MKLEKGKTYLVERVNKAMGGGVAPLQVQNETKDHMKCNGKWYKKKFIKETYKILEEVTEEDNYGKSEK